MNLPNDQSKYERLRTNLLTHYNSLIVPKLGIVFALLSQLFGSIMVLSSKLLEQDKDFPEPLNPFEVILVRMVLTSIVTMTYSFWTRPADFPFGPSNVRIFLLIRAVTGFTGIYTLYWAIQYISMSAQTVINFLNPLFTLILLYIALGEKYTIYEGIGGLFSIIGVTLVVQPSFLFPTPRVSDNSGVESSDPHMRTIGLLVALIGCFAGACSNITLRFIGKRCDAVISVQIFSIVSGIVSLFGLFFGPGTSFQKLTTLRQWYLFAQLGISGFLTQFFWTCGIAREKAGRLVLLSYFGMIYSIFWEFLIWGHAPTSTTWFGFSIIVASTAAIIYFKPNEIELEVQELEDRLSEEFLDEEGRRKIDIEMKDFIIDAEDDDDEEEDEGSSCLNSVRSKV